MQSIFVSPVRRLLPKVVPLTAAAALTVPSRTVAARASSQDQQVAKQRADLRAEVARLKAALAQQTQSMPSTAAPSCAMPPSMKMMDDMVLDDERAMLDRANAERPSARAEQELRTPTGADQPDASQVRAQAREIQELRTTQRLAFIRPLGDLARNLTADQCSKLLAVANTPPKWEAFV